MGEEVIGYIANKKEVEKVINDYINTESNNIAYIDIEHMPEYELNLVPWDKKDSAEDVFKKVKDSSVVTYRLYAIMLDYEPKEYVSTIDEAEQVVAEIKQEFEGMKDLNLGVQEIFTTDLNNVHSIDVSVAKASIDEQVIESSGSAVINGIILSKPVTGTVSSRYGSRWGRTHTGIDVAAATGTPIYACSKGTVKFTGVYGGYGNLVIVDHGSGIQTYYGHCSRIYASVGDEVTKDTVIAAVGSTGNSTGPHLHLEIRKNGTIQNPQNYLYN